VGATVPGKVTRGKLARVWGGGEKKKGSVCSKRVKNSREGRGRGSSLILSQGIHQKKVHDQKVKTRANEGDKEGLFQTAISKDRGMELMAEFNERNIHGFFTTSWRRGVLGNGTPVDKIQA